MDWEAKAKRLASLVLAITEQPCAEHCYACLTALNFNTGEPYHHHADDCRAEEIETLIREIRFSDRGPRSPQDNHPGGEG